MFNTRRHSPQVLKYYSFIFSCKNHDYASFSFEEIVQTIYTGHEIASTTNRYRKLMNSTDYGISYTRGVQYCSGKSS